MCTMMNRYIYLYSLILCLLSCSLENQRTDDRSISVDIEQRDIISVYDLFSDIELIPLETTSESLVREVSKIIPFKDRYYILDQARRRLFVFDHKGNFLFVINDQGDGPNQYINMSDVAFDRLNEKIVVLSAQNQALYFYDMDGNYLDKKRLPDIATGAYVSLQILNKDTICFYTADPLNKLKFYSFSQDTIFCESQVNESKGDIFTRNRFSIQGSYCNALNNTVYSLEKGFLTELYSWDFGDMNNSVEELEYPVRWSKEVLIKYRDDIYNSKQVNYVILEHGQSDLYRYAHLIRKNKSVHLFNDRHTGKTILFEETKEGVKFAPIYFGNDCLICPVYSDPECLLPECISDDSQKKIQTSISEEDNPLLVRYNFKTDNRLVNR